MFVEQRPFRLDDLDIDPRESGGTSSSPDIGGQQLPAQPREGSSNTSPQTQPKDAHDRAEQIDNNILPLEEPEELSITNKVGGDPVQRRAAPGREVKIVRRQPRDTT
jgi:hypothetical protein